MIARGGYRDGQEGVAALELALFMPLVFGLLVLIAPLGTAALAKVRLERAAGTAVRFATQTPDRTRPGTTIRRPQADPPGSGLSQVCNDAAVAYGGAGALPAGFTCSVTVTRAGSGVDPDQRRSGDLVTVRLTVTRDLSAFGGLLNAIGISTRSIDLSATSLAQQE